MGVPGVPWHTQILADHLTLSQPGGKDYVHLNTTGTPGFSDLPTALCSIVCNQIQTLTGVSYCTAFMFFRGGPNYKNGYWLEKKNSLKFLKCDQLTKVREQQYLYRVCRKSPWEKDFSLGKTSLVTANSLRLGPHGWPWPWPVGRANLLTTPPLRRNTICAKP